MAKDLFSPEQRAELDKLQQTQSTDSVVDPYEGTHEAVLIEDYEIVERERDGVMYMELAVKLSNLGNNGHPLSKWMKMRLPSSADETTLKETSRKYHNRTFMNFLFETGLRTTKTGAVPRFESAQELENLTTMLNMLKGCVRKVIIKPDGDFYRYTFKPATQVLS